MLAGFQGLWNLLRFLHLPWLQCCPRSPLALRTYTLDQVTGVDFPPYFTFLLRKFIFPCLIPRPLLFLRVFSSVCPLFLNVHLFTLSGVSGLQGLMVPFDPRTILVTCGMFFLMDLFIYSAFYPPFSSVFPFGTSMGWPYTLPFPRSHLAAWISRGDDRRFPRPMRHFNLFASSPASMLPPVSPLPLDLNPGSIYWTEFPSFELLPVPNLSTTALQLPFASFVSLPMSV